MVLGSERRSRGRRAVTGGMRWDVVTGNELKVTRTLVERGFLRILWRGRLFLSKETGRESTSEESGRIEGMRRAAQGATKAARELRLEKVVCRRCVLSSPRDTDL